jgi:hypothetical protein
MARERVHRLFRQGSCTRAVYGTLDDVWHCRFGCRGLSGGALVWLMGKRGWKAWKPSTVRHSIRMLELAGLIRQVGGPGIKFRGKTSRLWRIANVAD